MLRVIQTVTQDHQLGLVVLAAILCVLGCVSIVLVAERVRSMRRTTLWLVLLSICACATVWSTHFISMLAYQTELAITYDVLMTTLSFVVGVVVMGLGFVIAAHGRHVAAARALGGVVVGIGVIALHYLGMAGLRFSGTISYDTALVVASVVLSMGFGAAALSIIFGARRAWARLHGAALLLAMTVTLHFTAMGAIHLEPGVLSAGEIDGISRSALAIVVAVSSLSVLMIGLVGALVDQQIAERLAAEAERFRTLSDGAFEGLLVHHDNVLVDANIAARKMFGLGDDPVGLNVLELMPSLTPHANADNESSEEVELHDADGRLFHAEVSRRRIRLPNRLTGELIAVRDLTRQKASEARIAHLALHDPLTDLANRRLFAEVTQNTIARAHRERQPFALLAIDLDNFKLVNDLYGHGVGDELIKTVARRISATLREGDIVARLGGDEFALLEISASETGQVTSLADRLMETIGAPVSIDGGEINTNASIGIALYPADGETIEDLLRNADTAMYCAKAEGRGTYRFYEQHMNEALKTRRKFETRLRVALDEDALTVAYQPLVDTTDRAPLCIEALLRWNDAEFGAVEPEVFIPLAEEIGLVSELGEFVLKRACLDAAKWAAPLRVAVNLSPAQFKSDGLVEAVRAALAESGLPGERLELEVTESLLIDNRERALFVLTELKALGVFIAMDDFGTGYSSLSYLQCFDFDKIKIDRAFTSNLETSEQDASIVQAVVAMGKSLRMRVVAEGVETEEQARILAELDCDELQGFLIAEPMSAGNIGVFLDNYTKLNKRASNVA